MATAPSYGTSSHSLYNQGADQRPTRCEYRPCLPTRTLIAFAQELSRPAKRQSLAKFVRLVTSVGKYKSCNSVNGPLPLDGHVCSALPPAERAYGTIATSTHVTHAASAGIRLVQWPHDAKDATCGRVGRHALFLALVWILAHGSCTHRRRGGIQI